MKANELRFGNYVQLKDSILTVKMVSEYCIVGCQWAAIGEMFCDIKELHGIPITEEWLKRFWFEDGIIGRLMYLRPDWDESPCFVPHLMATS